jgi:phosphoribosylanthranilate isomerase
MSVRVKICGVTRAEDATAAADAGASAIGLVFWPDSPRALTIDAARAIATILPGDVTVVGVFVDQPATFVTAVAQRVPLHAIQLHGDERPEDYEIGLPVLKAVGVAGAQALARIQALPAGVLPLLDAPDHVRKGGTGRPVDWKVATVAARMRQIALAGGLTPANVADAIRIVRPHAIDVSSGVEDSPGVKNAAKVRALLAAARQAASAVPRGLP